ncbi:TetR family transcriptional regulator protein [Leptolyngbya boryana NIES-2135]|uniref:TetR family transcriptional regulator protein n=1 Tax=Leptolyngbya boryana NIES-2135 TaxID=1973484 RepID=A0A1Z4JNK5_LEPBY|nr:MULTISPECIES: TetR/AcrR family transcriptional regulator [Leptolyngbya]BAY58341.1 TetR family transcriptional regulator protein [Leptolyngbya boryana NIES-2135]MBD1857541.1 TetR/AcrR family transcriptional regulator [Leptolyngbya sp. FACHB-1624]MBD2368015.1 TetR/AcrR family transcriptional regulator [Leptolyngbya sp. FACHB-161]MBD2374539.1 TetR/AcrR family transcriptional regulator [Leptolyngbya sp. FACHB-238]MBD2398961.1 TetR/AcrR family transcriptional regulator [Leptolyngbya sp. FACHB-23
MVNLKRTREDILFAVEALIHHQGFQSTGLKELFAASGMSSGSFYNYFGSKDELAHALIDFKWNQIKTAVLDPAQASSNDPIAQVFWMIDQLEAKHLAEPDCAGCFLGNLIVEVVKQDVAFQHHLMQVFDEWQATIARSLKAGQNQLKPDIDPDSLAEQLLVMIEGALLLGRLYSEPTRLQRHFDAVRQLLRSALTA